MDNPRIGSLNSLADYGLGSDIEDSDEEVENKDSQVKPIGIVARPYVAQTRVTSSKLAFTPPLQKRSWKVRATQNVGCLREYGYIHGSYAENLDCVAA